MWKGKVLRAGSFLDPKFLVVMTLILCVFVSFGWSDPVPSPEPKKAHEVSNGSLQDRKVEKEKALEVVKRSAEESDEEETPTVYYPMIISKKSATVLNKLVTALRNSIDRNPMRNANFLREKELVSLRNSANYDMFNLQRRNQKERKNYLRCYFNAVSCF